MAGSALSVETIVCTFGGPPVLNRLSLSVPAGGIAVITGPSAVGKTTLLQAIQGEMVIASGRLVLGRWVLVDDTTDVPADKRPVALVPQGGGLDPRRNVGTNIAHALPGRERLRRIGAAKVATAFDLVGLATPMADRLPRDLSVGERQRVALARGLVQEPELLLLDEPFFALDLPTRRRLRTEMRDLLRVSGTTVVLVTHEEEEAHGLGDVVYRMVDGALEPA